MEIGSDPPIVPGRNAPARHLAAGGHLADLIACGEPRLLHAWWWRFADDWRFPERRVPNGMLYLPLRGDIILRVGGVDVPLRPGAAAILPEGWTQAGRYAPAAPAHLEAIVWHLVLHDPHGRDLLARFPPVPIPVPSWSAWRPRLVAAVRAFNGGGEDGLAYARITVRALLADLVLACPCPLRSSPAVDARLARAIDLVRTHSLADLGVADLARAAGVGGRRFRDLFRAATGLGPKDWLVRQRLAEAARRLRADPGRSVRTIAIELGFSSDHYFHASFRRIYGQTPTAWRRAPAGG